MLLKHLQCFFTNVSVKNLEFASFIQITTMITQQILRNKLVSQSTLIFSIFNKDFSTQSTLFLGIFN